MRNLRKRVYETSISDLLMFFAEALTRSGEDDTSAEALLRELVATAAPDTHGLKNLIIAKMSLSRVLRRQGKRGAAKEQ